MLFHGSHTANLQTLEPRSKLHGSDDEKVVYLTENIPYALVYIWDSEKTGTSQKWVTCGLKNGTPVYEEQFPDQLKAFYKGASGSLYCVENSTSISPMPNREEMYYSTQAVPVAKNIVVPDVYQELLRCEREGKITILRYRDASPEKQAELTDRIVSIIHRDGLLDKESDMAAFIRRYFVLAWQKAEANAQ